MTFINCRAERRTRKMKSSNLLLEKLKDFEGLRLEAYLDAAGVPTIGYGHTGRDVKLGDRITKYWANDLLRRDVEAAEKAIDLLGLTLTQGQLDALVSFTFNLGIDRLVKSTLLQTIREGGTMRQIRREFMRWVYAGGEKLRGLEKRRQWEADRFFSNDGYSY